MQKTASLEQIAKINFIVLDTLKNYLTTFVSDDDLFLDNLQMYAGDVEHNIAALQEFNATNDALALYRKVMQQDTLPREEFVDLFEYLREEELI